VWPDWTDFRRLGDWLLWPVCSRVTKADQMLGYFLPR
jgi:hypothetical protein